MGLFLRICKVCCSYLPFVVLYVNLILVFIFLCNSYRFGMDDAEVQVDSNTSKVLSILCVSLQSVCLCGSSLVYCSSRADPAVGKSEYSITVRQQEVWKLRPQEARL